MSGGTIKNVDNRDRVSTIQLTLWSLLFIYHVL